MENKKMSYKDTRKLIEELGNVNYENFVKAIISFEKGINDESALDKVYQDFMDNDSRGLLNEEFDYVIDELRDNGELDETIEFAVDKDDFVTVVGNIVGEVEVINKELNNGEKLNIVNFTVGNNDEDGNSIYTNCSSYGEKSDVTKGFEKGDFVKVYGKMKYSKDDKGNEYKNLRVITSIMLKKKEKKKESIIESISKFKEKENLAKKKVDNILKKDTER